ncbi:MAG: hypothetical protein CMM05_07405 [Rhodopirellula sp.]|nr:hypothetical protein [Rhodopirellula sp.]
MHRNSLATHSEMYWLVMDRDGTMFCVLRALVLLGLLVRLPLRRVVVQINPYESAQTQGGDAIQRRGGSLVVKIFVVISFLICTLLVFLAGWAWKQYWTYQRVPQNVGSFPYRAFAYDMTQLAVVGCLGVLALWSVFGCVCWCRARAAKR